MSTHSDMEMPYSSVFYNQKIRYIDDAEVDMRARDMIPTLSGPIPDCSLKYNVRPVFAACLIHHHFGLDADERTVEEDGKAAPSRKFNDTHALSWMFSDKGLYADDFQKSSIPAPSEAFSHEYRQILEQYHLSDLLGSRLTRMGPVGYKSTNTQEHISMTVPYPEHTKSEGYNIQTAPAFSA